MLDKLSHDWEDPNLKATVTYIGQAARIHWTVENELHWSLDVSFNEDQS